MSLVGTRPILQDELEQYELHHRARIAIKNWDIIRFFVIICQIIRDNMKRISFIWFLQRIKKQYLRSH